ncbi:hypothetical protein GCM10027404_33330 [Arthrobacter tumbae]|uniref:hypothetical protein n=1 Tax=Arthrobacter tumbae TaxID=163874 RepID=UPI00195B8A7C|nr:hypothetical protein [Arthrobacter tumbae]MBM7781926.1 apolipoprotein N-acyltransferase [Arthrobacter tumbae]
MVVPGPGNRGIFAAAFFVIAVVFVVIGALAFARNDLLFGVLFILMGLSAATVGVHYLRKHPANLG